MRLTVENLRVVYARGSPRGLDGITLAVEAGRTLAIVGPSGAGKTTLLRAIAGLRRIDGGDIRKDGTSIAGLSPQARRIALVFQDDALFAHMSVRANLHFGLRRRTDADGRIAAAAGALHAGAHLERRPRELSGGERQRVAIARALLSEPDALLLDEPLAHLDPALRTKVRDEVLGLRARFGGPILYVTHDHAEAMSVGDELGVLIDGRIEDVGQPQRVYDAPRTLGVARFLGERPMNLIEGDPIVGVRPEHVQIAEVGDLRGRVTRRESTGPDAYVHVETPRGVMIARIPAGNVVRPNDEVALAFSPEHVRRFDRASGTAIA